MHLIPTVIDQSKKQNYAYDIYSKLLEERIILLTGPIDDEMASSIIGQLLYLESKDKSADIHIYINSPGGSVSAGLAIYDTMNFVSCDVCTICCGMAASMAAILLASGTPGKRCSLKNSDIMIHQPLGSVEGQASDIEINTRHILKQKEKLMHILAKHTHQKLSKIKKDCNRDYYLDANEAIAYHLIDKII